MISTAELADIEFTGLKLPHPYREFLGEIPADASMAVWGPPGCGKSTWAIDFALVLANMHGTGIYCSSEEGPGPSMQNKIKRLGAEHDNLLVDDYDGFDNLKAKLEFSDSKFVVIDSISKSHIKVSDFQKFLDWCKANDIISVFILHTTKDGTYKGPTEYIHDPDIEIKVSQEGIARTDNKNRYQETPREMEIIFDRSEDRDNPGSEEEIFNFLPYIENPNEELRENKSVSPDEIYQMVTDMIINTIEKKGHLPWQQQWEESGLANGKVATNFVSKKPYKGINYFMLNFEQVEVDGELTVRMKDFDNPYFLTFNQVDDLGGKIKKGSTGYRVMYFTRLYKFTQTDPVELEYGTYDLDKMIQWLKDHRDDLHSRHDGRTAEDIARGSFMPILKYYVVFNGEDIEGIDFGEMPKNENAGKPESEKIKITESIYKHYPTAPPVQHKTQRAYYLPSADHINMPEFETFSEPQHYYTTLFHEAVHSTGHNSRLDRNMKGNKGGREYAKEELIAEMGAVYLCAESGILFKTIDNSASYLNSWNKRLVKNMKDDNRFFFRAASKAQAAVDYILDRDDDGVPAYRSDISLEDNDESYVSDTEGFINYRENRIQQIKDMEDPEQRLQAAEELRDEQREFLASKQEEGNAPSLNEKEISQIIVAAKKEIASESEDSKENTDKKSDDKDEKFKASQFAEPINSGQQTFGNLKLSQSQKDSLFDYVIYKLFKYDGPADTFVAIESKIHNEDWGKDLDPDELTNTIRELVPYVRDRFFSSNLPYELNIPTKDNKWLLDDIFEINPPDRKAKGVRKIPDTPEEIAQSMKRLTSNDDLRPALQRVYFDAEKGNIVATDGHALLKIPHSGLKETRLVDVKGLGEREETKYRDYEAIFPKGLTKAFSRNIRDLLGTASYARRAVKFTTFARFSGIIVKDEKHYNIDTELIYQLLKTMQRNGVEEVEFHIDTTKSSTQNGTRAVLVKDAGDSGIEGLLMPIMTTAISPVNKRNKYVTSPYVVLSTDGSIERFERENPSQAKQGSFFAENKSDRSKTRINAGGNDLVYLGICERISIDARNGEHNMKGGFLMCSNMNQDRLFIIPTELVRKVEDQIHNLEAEKLFEQFHHYEADDIDYEIDWPEDESATKIGTAKRIFYASDKVMRDGDHKGKTNFYKHDFDQGKRPAKVMDNILVVENIKWNERGILN